MLWTRRVVMALCCTLIVAAPALACTRFMWTNKLGVFVTRTMDWPESTEPVLTVFPRGLQREGGMMDGHTVVADNAARWKSDYGSLVTTVYGLGAADGVNEKGLCGHMLYLKATDFGPRDASVPGVHAGLWLQYVLDNAADVNEALRLLAQIQPVMVEANGHQATVHLAIEDARGDSAIVEYIAGNRVVHHGPQYRIMTNDPPYDEQLKLLEQYDFAHPSSDFPLPGNVKATDRFVRVAYFGAMLPEPKTEREAIASMMSIARNVSVPFGAPYKNFGIYNTEYRTAINLKTRRYYFELTTSPNVMWVDLSRLDFSVGAPVRTLDPYAGDLSGDVSDQLQAVDKSPY